MLVCVRACIRYTLHLLFLFFNVIIIVTFNLVFDNLNRKYNLVRLFFLLSAIKKGMNSTIVFFALYTALYAIRFDQRISNIVLMFNVQYCEL